MTSRQGRRINAQKTVNRKSYVVFSFAVSMSELQRQIERPAQPASASSSSQLPKSKPVSFLPVNPERTPTPTPMGNSGSWSFRFSLPISLTHIGRQSCLVSNPSPGAPNALWWGSALSMIQQHLTNDPVVILADLAGGRSSDVGACGCWRLQQYSVDGSIGESRFWAPMKVSEPILPAQRNSPRPVRYLIAGLM